MNTRLMTAALISSALMSGTATAAPLTDSMFNIFDADKNGELSMQEYRNGGLDGEGGEWSQGLSKVCTEHTLKAAEPELISSFKQIDDNNDNKITREEFQTNGQRIYNDYWKASFKQADRDNDQQLTLGEFERQTKNYLSKLEDEYAGGKIPTECKADMEYWNDYYKGMAQYIPVGFKYLDADGDKRLTFTEYKGTHLWD